ncbi:MAG TPA: hypothetical protein VF250_00920 [Conexibacter sp.]
MRFWKALVAVVGATALLGALATAASARNWSTSNQQIRSQFREVRFAGLFGTAVCQITMEGSFHARTTAKVVNALVGYIYRSVLGPCSTGTATVLSETLPWHVRYRGFMGTLPNITKIEANAIGASFNVRTPEGFTCLSRTTPEQPVIGSFNRDVVTKAITTSVIAGTIETTCGFAGTFQSDNGLTRLSTTGALIFITLI